MFRNAIVRLPGRNLADGITSATLGKPDYLKALGQHLSYTDALSQAGLKVEILESDERYPDSTFIEDVALCTPACAVITSPGAEPRRGETSAMRAILDKYYSSIEEIRLPGTIEAGDVMMAGEEYFIGISGRTNPEGARQLQNILAKYGYRGIKIPLKNLLHLKSGVSYLENNTLLASAELASAGEFARFRIIVVPEDEQYAANSLWINGTVLVAKGFEKTAGKIESAGYKTVILDVSEFRKLDGGLSCLSLRF